MPPIEFGAQGKIQSPSFTVKYDYSYPNGLDFTPGSEFHQRILTEVLKRVNESYEAISRRFASWNEMDQILTTYVSLSTADENLKQKDPYKPVQIVFPYSYSMLETLVTYLFIAFAQDPIFRYEGVTPEDTVGAMLLELVVQVHCNRNKVVLPLHTIFRDSLIYGYGVGVPTWTRKWGRRAMKGTFARDIAGQIVERDERYNSEEQVLFEGNELSSVDPYKFLPDPTVGIHEIQKGEYLGWISKENLLSLLREEERGDTDYFNVKYLNHLQSRKSIYNEDKSMRTTKSGGSKDIVQMTKRADVDIIHLYVDLIPKDLGLSEKESPEKWLFTIAADCVIIQATPLNLNHMMFPAITVAPDFDGYTSTPLSRLEILHGLQGILDFLFNTHITNVRKAVNDMFLVDPQLVNMNDFRDPKPGKLIRLRRPAWGKGVKDVAMQFPVNDITRANIADSGYIVEWMERVMGTDPSTAGYLRSGGPERLTKSEFQGTRQGAVSRLERVARIIGVQGMQDLGYMFGTHTQQLMDQDTYVKVVGDLGQRLLEEYGTNKVKATPFDLLIEYDTMVRDGSVPGGNFSEAWVEIFKIVGADPALRQQFDIFRIFSHIARGLGAKNIDDFRAKGGATNNISAQVLPDEQVQRELQAGNIVPTGV